MARRLVHQQDPSEGRNRASEYSQNRLLRRRAGRTLVFVPQHVNSRFQWKFKEYQRLERLQKREHPAAIARSLTRSSADVGTHNADVSVRPFRETEPPATPLILRAHKPHFLPAMAPADTPHTSAWIHNSHHPLESAIHPAAPLPTVSRPPLVQSNPGSLPDPRARTSSDAGTLLARPRDSPAFCVIHRAH